PLRGERPPRIEETCDWAAGGARRPPQPVLPPRLPRRPFGRRSTQRPRMREPRDAPAARATTENVAANRPNATPNVTLLQPASRFVQYSSADRRASCRL